MKLLTVICSRNPTNDLVECVNGIKKFYPFSDIVIIDSHSDQTAVYNALDVPVHYAKNTNYEFGAWKIAYQLYDNYDAYLCIQDTLIPRSGLPVSILSCVQTYTFFNETGFRFSKLEEKARELTKGTIYEDLIEKHCGSEDFRLATHNSFLIGNANLAYLIETLPNLPTTKKCSMAFERILGLVIQCNSQIVTRMNNAFEKRNGGRK